MKKIILYSAMVLLVAKAAASYGSSDAFFGDRSNYRRAGGGMFSAGESVLKEDAVKTYAQRLLEENQHLKATQQLIETSTQALTTKGVIEMALAKDQTSNEELEAQLQELKAQLAAEQSRVKLKDTKEQALLLEANQHTAALALETRRAEVLEEEKTRLKKIIADITAKEQEIASILRRNAEVGEAQDSTNPPEEADPNQIDQVIESNKLEIERLQADQAKLEEDRKKSAAKVAKLEKVIEANDHYTKILNMIQDQEGVTDDELALHMWSVCSFLGTDLDKLSEGREVRLIEALIRVSRPRAARPTDTSQITYDFDEKGCKRYLGNKFVDTRLGWSGPPLDMSKCTWGASAFFQTAEQLADLAKKNLTEQG